MTDEAKALVERLRDDLPQTLIEKHWVDDHDAIYKQREEAADLIETQAREIERLRIALHEIDIEAANTIPPDGKDAAFAALFRIAQIINPFRLPRAALAGDSHDQ